MRITVDIDEDKLNSVLKHTQQKKMSPAIVQAIDEYLEHEKRESFLKRVLNGQTDFTETNEALERGSAFEG